MKFRKFDDKYILRLDKNEEIVETIKDFCREQGIQLGWVSGIGAVNQATIGMFDTAVKEYRSRELNGDMEIVSLSGNISSLKGDVYLHLHVCLSNREFQTYGGHLSSATISGTGEFIVGVIEGVVEREFDPDIGLNIYQL